VIELPTEQGIEVVSLGPILLLGFCYIITVAFLDLLTHNIANKKGIKKDSGDSAWILLTWPYWTIRRLYISARIKKLLTGN